MKALIVIPTLNSENTILDVIADIESYAPDLEYLVINRGSTDRTKYVLENNNVPRLSFVVEANYFEAMSLAFIHAYRHKFDVVIEYSDLCEFNPRDIYYLIRTAENKQVDFVFASRFVDRKPRFLRNPGNRMMRFVINVFKHRCVTDPLMRFKLYNKRAVALFGRKINQKFFVPTPDRIIQALSNGMTHAEIRSQHRHQFKHQSNYRGIKYFVITVGWILSIIFVKPYRGWRRSHE